MKWEYAVVGIAQGIPNDRRHLVVALDEQGEDGWELVSVLDGERSLTLFFKRPIDG